MNSLAIFQTIINKLLRDLINIEKMGSFINDIMVETESEKGYNKLVEEILRRLEENNLYIKLEKCRWKVREIDFLKVVIEPEEIKMEKEKIKAVLDWPVPKSVKNIHQNCKEWTSFILFYFHFFIFIFDLFSILN